MNWPAITRTRAYSIALAIFALDRLTKWIIESRMPEYSSFSVIPGFFDIVHARNTGAAFSMLADSESPLRLVFLVGVAGATLVLVGLMLRKAASMEPKTALALSLILGGAIGNVFDRIVFGSVTDFLDFYIGNAHWPSFNVADSAIVVGSALLLLDLWKPKQAPART